MNKASLSYSELCWSIPPLKAPEWIENHDPQEELTGAREHKVVTQDSPQLLTKKKKKQLKKNNIGKKKKKKKINKKKKKLYKKNKILINSNEKYLKILCNVWEHLQMEQLLAIEQRRSEWRGSNGH